MSEDLRKAAPLVDYYQYCELLALKDKERYD